MSNTIVTADLISKFVLKSLLGSLVFRDLIYKAELSNEILSAKAGDTVNVKRPSVFKMKRFTDSLIKQELYETSVPVKLDIIGDITVPITSKEMTLAINDFNTQVLEPIGKGLAAGIDSYIATRIYQEVPSDNKVTAAATPTNLANIGSLALFLDKAKAPKQGRALVLAPSHKLKYAVTDNLSAVSYAGDSITLRDALLGRVYGFDTYESNYLPEGSGGGTINTITKITVAGNPGSKTVAITGADKATGTLKAGDLLLLDDLGRYITIQKEETAISNDIASIGVDQSELDDVLNGDYEVTVLKTTVSVAFSDIAFGLVNVPLEKPLNHTNSAVATYNGISVRVFYGYDQNKKEQVLSVDTLFGFATFYADASAKLTG